MTDPKSYQHIVYNIIGAAMSVQDELNWGMAEAYSSISGNRCCRESATG